MSALAVSFDECLRWARTRGATAKAMTAEIGCSRYRYYLLRNDQHWLCRAIILEAASRAMRRRGHGFQTTLIHFTTRLETPAA
jgi:hypothetical protein